MSVVPCIGHVDSVGMPVRPEELGVTMAGEDIFAAVALTLATNAAEALTEGGKAAFAALAGLIKRRFRGRGSAQAALVEAEADPADDTRIESLREELARAAAEDPRFDQELRRLWRDLAPALTAGTGGVINNVSGSVEGNVVQARDVQGGISFGDPAAINPRR
ncbi:hypothetical protein HH310_36730 [Actinoplanes sp. TBRC 11911]|uniref:hypothetical protein n=1 Tax=Actinoplanes sp. TBRC 11911 TaxID=2729386 RepID=UPI00145E532F|nr:hypothetical protein [Actinoplanes sp. TBRC 11911]NMO56707.1 hypothetical protein [Actinoplanes sp. TBRC 11911]